MIRWALIFTVLICLCISPVQVFGAGDPLVIDLLYISRAVYLGVRYNPIMTTDPALNVHPVPMPGHYQLGRGGDINILNRYMRMYMPRNYDQMVGNRDMVLMYEAPLGIVQYPDVYFDPKWISWFVKAVEDDGLSFLMMGGDASWGGRMEGSSYYKSWGDTMLDRILPFESFPGTNPDRARPMLPYFRDDHPLSRLPWKEARHVELLNKVLLKPGATLIAEAGMKEVRYPWISTWTAGQGLVVGEAQVFGSAGHSNYMFFEWDWFPDYWIYLAYLAAGKPIPDDIYRAHRIRGEINLHVDKTSLLISLLEFIEKFGAKTLVLYDELDAVNLLAADARKSYLLDDYDLASEQFEEVHRALDELNGKAIVEKQAALVWVYMVEWFTVSGAALISGVFVWTVMIKRRFYREIGITRAS